MAHPHRMAAAVPGIEIADDGDPRRVRCPNRKSHAADAVDRHGLGAETVGQLEMPAFVEQVQVDIAEQQSE